MLGYNTWGTSWISAGVDTWGGSWGLAPSVSGLGSGHFIGYRIGLGL